MPRDVMNSTSQLPHSSSTYALEYANAPEHDKQLTRMLMYSDCL